MDNSTRQKKILWTQIILVVVIALAIIGISAVTYDNGVLDEEAFLSLDKNSENYYMDRLNSDDISFTYQSGADYEGVLNANFPEANLVAVTAWDDMMIRTVYGKENGFVAEEGSVDFIKENNKTLYAFEEPVGTVGYSFSIRKDSKGAEILNDFNEYLSQIQTDGTDDRFWDKWKDLTDGNGIVTDISVEEYDFAPDAEELNIITIADWAPYVFFSGDGGDADNAVRGYFVDVIYYFCYLNGYKPVITNTTAMDSAIMGLTSGKYDLILYGSVPNEEKSEQVYFTNPTREENLILFTRVSEVEGIDAKEYVGGSGFFEHVKSSLNKNLIVEDRWKMLTKGFSNTLILAILSAILGTLMGAVIYFISSRNGIIISSFGRLYINIFQRLPDVLLLLILCYIVFSKLAISGMAVCVVAFSLSFSSYVSEMIRSGVEAVPEGQLRAALALGFSKPQAFFKIVVPQVVRIVLPVYKGLLITLVLNTSIAGYIAVEDLTKMSDIIRSNTFEALVPMLISALIYFLATLIFGLAITAVERKMDPKHRRRLPKWVEELQKQ